MSHKVADRTHGNGFVPWYAAQMDSNIIGGHFLRFALWFLVLYPELCQDIDDKSSVRKCSTCALACSLSYILHMLKGKVFPESENDPDQLNF